MENRYTILLLFLVFISFGCNAEINPVRCEINIKQGTTDIPSGSGFFNFGNLPLDFSQLITFTIENTGIHELILMSYPPIKIQGSDPNDFIVVSSTTKQHLQPNSSTEFSINFYPKSIGKKTALISIPSNDRNENPYTFVIIGTCTPPAPEMHVKQASNDIMSITGTYDFGKTNENKSTNPVIFTIENNGNEELELTGNPYKINVIGNNSSMFIVYQSSTQPKIAASSSTSFSVSFKPTSAGIKTTKISILSNDSDENPYIFTLYGTGVAAPEINLKKGSENIRYGSWLLDFGDVLIFDTSPEHVITIENLGSATLQLTSPELIEFIGSDASMFSLGNTLPTKYIAKGKSTTFSIVFKPTSLGEKRTTVSIASNDDDENPYTFSLKGTCVAPEINIKQGTTNIPNSTGLYDFGLVYVGLLNKASTFTIVNMGTGDLKLTGSPKISISGTNSALFTVDDSATNTPIHAGLTTTFSVIYTPVNTGVYTATISIANNDLDENPYTFALKVTCFDVQSGSAIGWIGGSTDGWQTRNAIMGASDYKSFKGPVSVFNDSVGNIYVADTNNNRVCKWDKDGNAIGWIGGGSNGWKTGSGPYSGNDYQSFNHPCSVFVDTSGNIYVADVGNDRVCKWDKNGNAIGWIGNGSNGWKTGSVAYPGKDYQSFNHPYSVFVDTSGNIYVTDGSNYRVCKWDKNGNAIGWIGDGSNGWKTINGASNPGQDYQSFDTPIDVVVDSAGYIYVSDSDNNRICKWDSAGNAIGWIGGDSDGWKTGLAPTSYSTTYRGFYNPNGLSIDSSGNIYVSDASNDRICKWNASGNAIGWIGDGSSGWKTSTAPLSSRSDYQSFDHPYDVYIDAAGFIYVADTNNYRICKWKD